MENTIKQQEELAATINNQNPQKITKKISFNKETYRNLVTIASREYFDSKLKEDEKVTTLLDEVINSYYKQYWNKNKPA
jgi:uncharacterized protein (UPF0128 family)